MPGDDLSAGREFDKYRLLRQRAAWASSGKRKI